MFRKLSMADYHFEFGRILNQELKFRTQVMAKCPFHNDNKPSLSINLEKGLYYCFGCGEKGNLTTLKKHFFDGEY
ncbi:MAG: hypothetical protein H6621_06575 [Halobacteriovoraceae bacterium]|nr:hypothetical protein [Halobacteriovoraceae bacterium]